MNDASLATSSETYIDVKRPRAASVKYDDASDAIIRNGYELAYKLSKIADELSVRFNTCFTPQSVAVRAHYLGLLHPRYGKIIKKRASVAALDAVALNRVNVERWFARHLGLDDIAALTGQDREYVKDCAKQWGLWA